MKLYKICNKISLLLHVLASAAGYFVMEAICRHSFIEAWNYMTQRPLVFAYNAAFIFTSSLIVYLFHRRVFWRVLVTLFWLILAIINGVLLLNRVTPFTGPDLHLITDAMKIANKYLPVAGVVAVCILFGILVILLLMLLIKGPKYQKKIKYRYNIPLILLAVALFAGSTQLALEKRVLSNYFGNIAFAYEDYGYPYCLTTTILIRESVVREIILRKKSKELRKRKRISRKRRKKSVRIFCFCSWNHSLILRWLIT